MTEPRRDHVHRYPSEQQRHRSGRMLTWSSRSMSAAASLRSARRQIVGQLLVVRAPTITERPAGLARGTRAPPVPGRPRALHYGHQLLDDVVEPVLVVDGRLARISQMPTAGWGGNAAAILP